MPCPSVPAAAAEGGTRLADNPASASAAADGTAKSSAVSAEATAVGAAAKPANGPVVAREAADEAAGAAVGPKDALGWSWPSYLLESLPWGCLLPVHSQHPGLKEQGPCPGCPGSGPCWGVS